MHNGLRVCGIGPDRPSAGFLRNLNPVYYFVSSVPVDFTAGLLVEKTGITPATVNKALSHLERLGIVRELTAQKRNRVFSYGGYVEILSRGTEPPER